MTAPNLSNATKQLITQATGRAILNGYGAYFTRNVKKHTMKAGDRTDREIEIVVDRGTAVVSEGLDSNGKVPGGSKSNPLVIKRKATTSSIIIERNAWTKLEDGDESVFRDNEALPEILIAAAKHAIIKDIGEMMAQGQCVVGTGSTGAIAGGKVLTKAKCKIKKAGKVNLFMDGEINGELYGDSRMNTALVVEDSWKNVGFYGAYGMEAVDLQDMPSVYSALAATIGTDGSVSFTSSNATAGNYYYEDGYLVLASSSSAGNVVGGFYPASSKTVSAAASSAEYKMGIAVVEGYRIIADFTPALISTGSTNVEGVGVCWAESAISGHCQDTQLTLAFAEGIGDSRAACALLYKV